MVLAQQDFEAFVERLADPLSRKILTLKLHDYTNAEIGVRLDLSIWAVEARHASVAGLLVKAAPDSISPEKGAFQITATAAEVLKAVEGTGFLK